jgi:hypothetical protein
MTMAETERIPRPTCATCPHYFPTPARTYSGLCRLEPPVVVVEGHAVWPPVEPQMWCGKHPDALLYRRTEWVAPRPSFADFGEGRPPTAEECAEALKVGLVLVDERPDTLLDRLRDWNEGHGRRDIREDIRLMIEVLEDLADMHSVGVQMDFGKKHLAFTDAAGKTHVLAREP